MINFLKVISRMQDNLKTIKPDYYYRVDFSELTMETYIAGKNELLNSLADPKIFNYINKVFKDISNDPKVQNWNQMQRAISKVDLKKEERKLNLDDATNVALKRLQFFTYPSNDMFKDVTREKSKIC